MTRTEPHPLSKFFLPYYFDRTSDWKGTSGVGSNPYWTMGYRHFLESFLNFNEISSIVDLGCGDWRSTRFLNLDRIRYHGFDVVAELVEQNQETHGTESIGFDLAPVDLEFPDADLLIVKDVLQHMPSDAILEYCTKVISKYPWALLTNSYRKFDRRYTVNSDIDYGGFRPLDLTAPPFDLPGTYVFEHFSRLQEQVRTLLVVNPDRIPSVRTGTAATINHKGDRAGGPAFEPRRTTIPHRIGPVPDRRVGRAGGGEPAGATGARGR